MPDAFFASASKKRKRPSHSTHKSSAPERSKALAAKKPGQKRQKPVEDEELDSDSSQDDVDVEDLRVADVDPESDKDEYENETPAEKRLRLAKIYLESVKEGLVQGEGDYDAAEIDRDIISARLKQDVLQHAGKVYLHVAESIILDGHPPSRLRIKGHRMTVTSAVVSHDGCKIYVAGKEGGVSCCDVKSGKRLFYAPKMRPKSSGPPISRRKSMPKGSASGVDGGHSDEVLALALSGDGKYLASAGKDRRVGIWEISDDGEAIGDRKRPGGLVWVRGFGGHKDTISGLSFRNSTNILYSASFDRTIKLFDLSHGVMNYVETLFGHQDSVTGLDSLTGDTAVSCGGRDRTIRFWKIADETQLVFRGGGTVRSKALDILDGVMDKEDNPDTDKKSRTGHNKEKWVEGSVDCVAMVDEETFLSGGDSGSVALWTISKKKPMFSYPAAHGLEEIESSTEGRLRRPRWITSLACLPYADLFASGSWDGHIRLWRLDRSLRSFSPVGLVDAPGMINSLQLMAMPKGWRFDEEWPHLPQMAIDSAKGNVIRNGDSQVSPNGDITKPHSDEGVLLVAGVGQEPRLGRWMRLNGSGAVNCALIFSLRMRKSTR